ncbi:MAG TPA: hypothetical protein VM553_17095 [Dongiaceae bacterium]|nr:hypothetical protein [Dongiaceae bacterium]
MIDGVADFSADAYVGLSYQYIYQGVAQRSDDAVARLGLSLQQRDGWFLDTWGGRTDTSRYDGGSNEEGGTSNYYAGSDYASRYSHDNDDPLSRQWEWDFNAGYSDAIGDQWQWALSHAWIERQQDDEPNQNYQEWRANLFFRDSMSLLLSYSDDYRHTGWSAFTAEWGLLLPMGAYVDFDAGAGWVDGIGGRDNYYGYGWLGLSGELTGDKRSSAAQGKIFGPLQWRVRCYHSGSAADKVLGEDRAGTQWEILFAIPLHLLSISK